MSDGKYEDQASVGALIRRLERSRERAAAAAGIDAVVIPVLHGDPDVLVEGLIWFDLDATC